MTASETKTTIATIGIDTGKNTLHLVGLDGRGAIVLRQKMTRSQAVTRLANMPCCLIGIEACVGAHRRSETTTASGLQRKWPL